MLAPNWKDFELRLNTYQLDPKNGPALSLDRVIEHLECKVRHPVRQAYQTHCIINSVIGLNAHSRKAFESVASSPIVRCIVSR